MFQIGLINVLIMYIKSKVSIRSDHSCRSAYSRCGNLINKQVLRKKFKWKTCFKQTLYSLVVLECFYQISSRFNKIWLVSTCFFYTNDVFTAFDPENQSSHLPTQTPLYCLACS